MNQQGFINPELTFLGGSQPSPLLFTFLVGVVVVLYLFIFSSLAHSKLVTF